MYRRNFALTALLAGLAVAVWGLTIRAQDSTSSAEVFGDTTADSHLDLEIKPDDPFSEPEKARSVLFLDGPGHPHAVHVATPGATLSWQGNGNPENEKLQLQEKRLNAETQKLAQQLRAEDSGSKRRELLDQLEKTVTAHFDIRERIRKTELDALADRLKKLQNVHDRRQEARKEIVGRRVEQIVREADGLGWGQSRRPSGGLFVPGTTSR